VLIYEGIKSEFLDSVVNDTIAMQIDNNIFEKMNRHTAINEFRSWENSMQYMYKVLNDEDIPEDVGIAIEYNIPLTSKRVDFIISGLNENKIGQAIVVELKQWNSINVIKDKEALVETYTGNAMRTVVCRAAAAVSIFLIFAWAWGLRPKTASGVPGSFTSST
jgi:hypothetical protein